MTVIKASEVGKKKLDKPAVLTRRGKPVSLLIPLDEDYDAEVLEEIVATVEEMLNEDTARQVEKVDRGKAAWSDWEQVKRRRARS